MFHKASVPATLLRKVGEASDYDPRIGDLVKLNSGSPNLLVLDFDETTATCGWKDHAGNLQEITLPASCFKHHWCA